MKRREGFWAALLMLLCFSVSLACGLDVPNAAGFKAAFEGAGALLFAACGIVFGISGLKEDSKDA